MPWPVVIVLVERPSVDKKLYVSLPEMRRLAELLDGSPDKADQPLRDRLLAVVVAETESRAERRLRAIRAAVGVVAQPLLRRRTDALYG